MSIFHQLRENRVLVSAVIAFFAAQPIEFLLGFWSTGTVKFERLLGNSSMSSSHSAAVSASALGAGCCYGAVSFEFAVSFIPAMTMMADAISIHQETGKQSKLLNKMMETNFWEQEDFDLLPVKLKRLVGRTPLQIAAGVMVGILVALVAEYGLYR